MNRRERERGGERERQRDREGREREREGETEGDLRNNGGNGFFVIQRRGVGGRYEGRIIAKGEREREREGRSVD